MSSSASRPARCNASTSAAASGVAPRHALGCANGEFAGVDGAEGTGVAESAEDDAGVAVDGEMIVGEGSVAAVATVAHVIIEVA